MKIKTWIKIHTELGTLRGKTGTRLIKILNNTGVTYIHQLEDVELRRFKGCGEKTFERWNTLKNVDYWTRHLPRLYRGYRKRHVLEERISELEDKNRRLENALSKEKHFNSTTSYGSLRKKLTEDNAL